MTEEMNEVIKQLDADSNEKLQNHMRSVQKELESKETNIYYLEQ
jgi:hypothetical protein